MPNAMDVETVATRVQAKLAPLLAEVSARSHLMIEHPHPRNMYLALLELLHSEVRASVPLLVSARRQAVKLAAEGDTVAGALIEWLDRHIAEEADHDTWLLADYRRVGGDADLLVLRPGSPTVGAMVGSVYYWTIHAHPVAILGYCVVLEAIPPSPAFVDRLVRVTGFSPEAFATLRHHSAIDVDHSRELFELIDTLPVTARHEALITMTALQTADLLIAAGDELLDDLESAA